MTVSDTIWLTNCPLANALAVAVHTGQLSHALAPLGVGVNMLRHEPSAEVRLSHFRHTVPGQLRHGGHIPPLWSRSEGRDVRLIGLSWTRESQLVLVRGDSELNAIADLRGRRLALPVRADLPIDFWQASTLKAWTSILELAGLSLSDVELVKINVPAKTPPRTNATRTDDGDQSLTQGVAEWTLSAQRSEAHALLNGEVDAVFSPGHYGASLRRFLGARILFDLSTAESRGAWVNNATLLALSVDGRFFDDQPEAVDKTVATILQASRWAAQHRRETARIFAAESGNAEELIEEIFGDNFADALAITLSTDALEALTAQNKFLYERGFVTRIVPPEEWLESEPLERALKALSAAPPVEIA
jgi:ABC-type nitrate/sulfonate/bicarbonate transport system substrate-binding protein